MSKSEHIVLVGFMGTGKTAIAREISRTLGFTHIETDQLIEERERMSITKIFAQKGEEYFRQVEHDLLKEISQETEQQFIISTGGGMPLMPNNRPLIKQLGFIVWLQTSLEETFRRIGENKDRPLLQGGDTKQKIQDLMLERAPIYKEVSQFRIDTTDLTTKEISSGVIDSASYHFSKTHR